MTGIYYPLVARYIAKPPTPTNESPPAVAAANGRNS